MRFLKITANNIFSLGEGVTLDLDNRGLLLVRGWSEDENNENGSGKSSLVNKSLIWCLYGKTAAGTRGDKVINRHTRIKKASVSVTFEADDGEVYTIFRSQPSKVTLYKGDTDISLKTSKATQEALEILLGRNFDTFCQSEFFGQGRPTSFFQMTPAAQTSTVQNILPMEQLDVWAEKSRIALQDIHIILKRAEGNYDLLSAVQHKTIDRRASTLEISDNWEQEHLVNLNNLKANIEDLIEQNGDVPNQIKKIQSEIDSLNYTASCIEDITSMESDIVEQEKKIEENNKLHSEATISFQEWKAHSVSVTAAYDTLHRSIKTQCDTCGQSIPKERIEQLSIELNEMAVKIGDCLDPLEKSKKAREHYDSMIGESRGIVIPLAKKIDELTKIQSNYSLYQTKLQALNLCDISVDISLEKSKLDYEKEATNPYIDTALELNVEIEESNNKIDEAKVNIERLKLEVERVEFWREAYGKHIKTYLLDQACPFLQEKTNYYLSELGNPQITVEFSTIKGLSSGDSKDQFNVSVVSKTGGAEFDLLSGGEQQMASFAAGLALADLANTQATGSSNLIVLDEPFENLSPKNSSSVVEFLTTKFSKESVLLISNEAAILELVPNSILVTKTGGISNVN